MEQAGRGGFGKENVDPQNVQTEASYAKEDAVLAGKDVTPKRTMVVAVDETMERLLMQEDTNSDGLITVEDAGPKSFTITSNTSNSSEEENIQGNYHLANLLQELYFAKLRGDKTLNLDLSLVNEGPVSRIKRLIQTVWWDNLTRRMDADGIVAAAKDPKTAESQPRIYIPSGAPEQYEYYDKIARDHPEMHLEVHWLPKGYIDPEFIKSLNSEPGILALDLDIDETTDKVTALPYIVPGDRFNELYNWDSVFVSWGLLESHPHIVKSIIRHFTFEIKHYGKVLNANRTYYLGRAQPPFLTDLALRTFEKTKSEPDSLEVLKNAIFAGMKEYHDWWKTEPRLDRKTGLSRYRPVGAGFPPECEPGQFVHVCAPWAKQYGMDTMSVMQAYNNGEIQVPDLDDFCKHDRAVRESGHDVSNRVEGVCADLATVDLNCLLYKIEKDIAHVIRTHFNDQLEVPVEFCEAGRETSRVDSSAIWEEAASNRMYNINKYLWNEERGFYFDYNIRDRKQTDYESVTTFWALWSGVANDLQAAAVVKNALPLFENIGGLSVSTEKSRGPVTEDRPQKQWDYPYGWPPHQLLAWEGLQKYGFDNEMERIVYRWLRTMTSVFVDYNGAVVEKYDVTRFDGAHKVEAEYGNQGSHFKYAPMEGFGWTNASYIVGLKLLSDLAKECLADLKTYEEYRWDLLTSWELP